VDDASVGDGLGIIYNIKPSVTSYDTSSKTAGGANLGQTPVER
jgi:hypothetical protein